MQIEYHEVTARKYTFQILEVKKWVENNSKGFVLNLFAGKTKLNVDEIRVDLSNEFKPDYNMEALEFVNFWKKQYPNNKFDTIILDPPFSYRKSKEKYNNNWTSKLKRIRDFIPAILNPGGRVINFGYNTVGMGKSRGFKKMNLIVLCHLGDFDDTMGIVEESENLFQLKSGHFKDYFGLLEQFRNKHLAEFIE